MPGRPAREVLLGCVTVAVVLVAAVGMGVLCAFLVPLRLPGGIEGCADVLALVAATGLGVLVAWGTRWPATAVLPGVSMIVVTYLAAQRTPGGGLVIPGAVRGDPGIGTVGLLLLAAEIVGVVVALLAGNALHSRARLAEDKERDGAR